MVIGAGPGGYAAAVRAAQAGAQVSLIEDSGAGGTCLHRGCIPTKTLLASAQALETARRLGEFGITSPGGFSPDIKAIMARKDQVVALQAQGLEKLFASHGIAYVKGRARLLAPGRVAVELTQGGQEELACDQVILATGSRPVDLPGLKRDGRLVLNSDDALGLAELPGSICIVGGGVVGCEMACILAGLGVRVTLVEALERLLPLPSLDAETSKLLLREFKKRRITVHLSQAVRAWRPEGAGLAISLGPWPARDEAAPSVEVKADCLLVAVGRAPNSQGLGLEEAGVRTGPRGEVLVDAHLATSAPSVYALGDLLGASRPMLAHVAGAEAAVAAANALGASLTMDYAVVPAVAFTQPEVAWVGLSPEQAQAQGLAAANAVFPFRLLGKSQAMGEIAGQCKLVYGTQDQRLLGAHIIGPHAADLIHECALALKLGASLADLAGTIHAHPTLSEALHQAAEAGLGHCPHLPPA